MAAICPCGGGADIDKGPKVTVHGEFQDEIPYDEQNQTHRVYDITKLPIAAVFPDSETQGMIYEPGSTKLDLAQSVRIYRFFVSQEARVVEIRYKPNHFYLFADGNPKPLTAKAHNVKLEDNDVCLIPFVIPQYLGEVNLPEGKDRLGEMFKCDARMRWRKKLKKWAFKVTVHGIPVPCVWSSCAGEAGSSYIPDVLTKRFNVYELDDIQKGLYNAEWFRENIDQMKRKQQEEGDQEQGMVPEEVLEFYAVRVWHFVVEKGESEHEKIRAVEVARKQHSPDESGKVYILVDGRKVGEIEHSAGKSTCEFDVQLTGPNEPKIAKGHITMRWRRLMQWCWDYQLAIGEDYITPINFKGDHSATTSFFAPVMPRISAKDSAGNAWGSDASKWKSLQNGTMGSQSAAKVKSADVSRVFQYTVQFALHIVTVLHVGGKFTFLVDGEKFAELQSKGRPRSNEEAKVTFKPHPEFDFEFTCVMNWDSKLLRWAYVLEVSGAAIANDMKIFPMFGKCGVGAPLEIVDANKIGLTPKLEALERLVYDKDTITEKEAKKNDDQIVVAKKGAYSSFEAGDIIKIEGPVNSDPQAFHKIDKTVGTIFKLTREIQCEKRLSGAKVVLLTSGEKNLEEKVTQELRYILRERLSFGKEQGQEQYGLRFVPGEIRMKFDAQSAVYYDIPELLALCPSYHIKIVGYTGKSTANDIYKTEDDLKYLALKRCEIVKLILNERIKHLRGKEVDDDLIGIEGEGNKEENGKEIPSCCLIVKSSKEENKEKNKEAKDFVDTFEADASDKRFFIKTTRAVDDNYGNNVDNVRSKWDVISTQGGVPNEFADQSPEDQANFVMRNVPDVYKGLTSGYSSFNKGAVTPSTPPNAPLTPPGGMKPATRTFSNKSNKSERSGRFSTHEKILALNKDQKQAIQYYGPDEELEFFSKTHRKWLRVFVTRVAVDEELQVHRWLEPGIEWAKSQQMSSRNLGDIISPEKEAQIRRHGGNMDEGDKFAVEKSRVFYDIMFARSKKQHTMVEVDSLRKPLCFDGSRTLVEVYSKQDGGTWLPGEITEAQPSATTLGYDVSVTMKGQPQKLNGVPAERIRRRFPKDTNVLFYHSQEFGWQPATIAPQAGDDGCSQGKSGQGVTELDWVNKAHETFLKTMGDNRAAEAQLPQLQLHGASKNQGALQQRQADVDEELRLERSESGAEESTLRQAAKAEVLDIEPWTTVPIVIDSETAEKKLKMAAETRVELWRLRMN